MSHIEGFFDNEINAYFLIPLKDEKEKVIYNHINKSNYVMIYIVFGEYTCVCEKINLWLKQAI